MGTGAFSFVSAKRDISVTRAGDKEALLDIEPAATSNGQEYASISNGQITLDFTSTDNGGSGLNREAFSNFEDVLNVKNQGSQSVNLSVGVPGGQEVPVDEFAVSGNPEDIKRHEVTGKDPSGTAVLNPGDTNTIGFFFNQDQDGGLGSVLQKLNNRGIVITGSTNDQFERGIFAGQ
jgi:hypothetical protein